MGMREDALALADELEAFEDGDCEECIAYGQPECKGHLSCAEIIARYAARKMREALERDGEDATTVSAYDLLSDEDREALAWVREMGGIERCEAFVHQGAMEHGYLLKVAEMLGTSIYDGTDNADALLDKLEKRLMPEGTEWPTVDGEPVVIGERMRSCGIEDCKVVGIDPANARLFLAFNDIEEGKAVYFPDFAGYCHRPASKVLAADGEPLEVGQTVWEVGANVETPMTVIDVDHDLTRCEYTWADGKVRRPCLPPSQLAHQRPVLDADGVEIREGDVLYSVETGDYVIADSIEPGNPWFATTDGALQHCAKFTHRAPVLAADGEPIREGETVWHVGNGVEFTVIGLPRPGEYQAVKLRLDDGAVTGFDPDQLTHQRPVLDADGVPIHVGDTVWNATTSARPLAVREIERSDDPDEPEDIVWCGERAANGFKVWRIADQLTHAKPEPPDSRQAIVNEIGDEMAARIDLPVSSGRWSDAD